MDIDVFNTERPLLFSIAYRMLGSASDAEDVLQDAWMRYRGAAVTAILSPKAFATTIVPRLCLDRLRSARTTREQYIGPWLPEPVLTSEVERPDTVLQRAESVTLAFMVLLETLSPEERAVFLLREVFEHDHADIAAMLDTTPANSRQLFHRARARIAEKRPRFRDAAAAKRPLVDRFVHALRDGDADAFTSVLAADVGFWSDGGGKALAAKRPVFGRDAVAHLLVGFRRSAPSAGVNLADV